MKTLKKAVCLLLITVLCLASLSACGSTTSESKAVSGDAAVSKLVVAVSIVPEQTFVNAVCGDLVDTIVMVPPGYSPENYEPTPVEMTQLAEAIVYFSVGVPIEEVSVLPMLAENTQLVSLADACKEQYAELELGGGRDPHIWLSPKRVVVMVNAIADEMSKVDPANAQTYTANAEAYIGELSTADAEIRESLSNLKSRSFICYHPAFGYFSDEYDLNMYALENDGKEATAPQLAEMTDFAKQEMIKVIFYQAEIDSSQSEAFAEEIRGKSIQLDPLSGDYIENLKSMASRIAEVNG